MHIINAHIPVIFAGILFIVAAPLRGNTFAQDDSLTLHQNILRSKELIHESKTDSAIGLLFSTSQKAKNLGYWQIFYDSEIALAKLHEEKGDLNDVIKDFIELIRELEKHDQFELLANAYFALGEVYLEYELSKKALGYFFLSNDYYERSGNIDKQLETLDILGHLYLENGDYEQSEDALYKAIQLSEKEKPMTDISPFLKKLVLIYQFTGDENKMLAINRQLFNIAKEKSDLLAIANSLTDLGYNYVALDEYPKALKHFIDAYFTKTVLNQPDDIIATALTNIGITYHHLNENLTAIDTLKSALVIWEKIVNEEKIAELNNLIANIYTLEKEYRVAENYASNALSVAEKLKNLELLRDSYQTFSQVYQQSNNFEKALKYYKDYLEMNDSIQKINKAREALISQREFNAEKAEKELSLIIADQEVKDLAMRQLALEAESSLREIELLKSNQELQQLENERALQELKITQQALEAAKKDREIDELHQRGDLQRLALARKEAEEKEQKKTIELLQQKSMLREEALERTALRRKFLFMTIGLLIAVLTLIIIGYFQKRRDNKLLSRQKESILKINRELEEKNNKIAAQKDELEDSFKAIESTLEKLKRAQKQLIESEKMASLGQITAGIAHEINNPINFVSSNINPLKLNLKELREVLEAYQTAVRDNDVDRGKLEEARNLEDKYDIHYVLQEIDLLLNGITEGASRTREIIRGLRNFSRIDQHELRRADIHEALDSTLILLKNNYKNRIIIKKEYDEKLEPIECYPGQLNQVFMNILNNAIQAIEDNGTITIRTKKMKSRVVIWISDDGKGISRNIRYKIFDPFFTTKEVGEGTGLGLSISYGIVQQHKGKIKVNSKPGEGTTFKISLPLVQSLAKPEVVKS